MKPVHAVYEKGVFRPTEPVDLPEQSQVVFEPRLVEVGVEQAEPMAKVYEVLSRNYDAGMSDLAARHDEHQP